MGDPPDGVLSSSPPREAAASLGCRLPVQCKVRALAFCENRNSGAGELGLGSNFQSRYRLYYLLLNLLLAEEPSPRSEAKEG